MSPLSKALVLSRSCLSRALSVWKRELELSPIFFNLAGHSCKQQLIAAVRYLLLPLNRYQRNCNRRFQQLDSTIKGDKQ